MLREHETGPRLSVSQPNRGEEGEKAIQTVETACAKAQWQEKQVQQRK